MSARVVLVTGANGAIGQAICQGFAAQGWSVVATDRHDAGVADSVAYAGMDLTRAARDSAYRRKRIDALLGLAGGRVDCLVNNAAQQHTGSLTALTDEQIAQSFDVNAVAPMLLVRDLAGVLRDNRGSVINILSIHAQLTKPGFSLYAATKAALTGMTRALAVDLAPDIRVNGIAPAAIATPMLEDGFADPAKLEQLREYHPAGVIGTPGDVAGLCVYLAGQESRFLTGAIIGLDGGIGARLHDPD